MALTIKQEKFCNYYLECGNASEAYRRAFSCDKMKEKTVWEKASLLLSEDKVRARVDELRLEMQRRSDITKDKAISILTNIAQANVVDMLSIKKVGDLCIFLIDDISKLPNSFQLAIQSVKSTDKGFEVKMYSKIDALDRLSKMMGWDAPEKKDITSNGKDINTSIQVEIIDRREQVDEDTND